MIRTAAVILASIAVAIALPPLWFALFPSPAPELPPPGRRVEVQPGVGVNVVEVGEGPPVVLVHGHPGSAYDWAPLMVELAARGYRVIAYDRVGYGRSDARRDGRYTVAANADELLALLAALDLRDVVLVGWSYGGGVAVAAAREDPARIAGLVLVGSVGPGIEDRPGPPALIEAFLLGPGLSWLARVPPLDRRLRAEVLEHAFAPDPVAPELAALLDANFARADTRTTFRSEGKDLAEAPLDPSPIDRPILVVHGEEDQIVPRAVGLALYDRARRARLWIVPRGGHMLPVTHARPLAARIADFAAGAISRPAAGDGAPAT